MNGLNDVIRDNFSLSNCPVPRGPAFGGIRDYLLLLCSSLGGTGILSFYARVPRGGLEKITHLYGCLAHYSRLIYFFHQ